MASACLFPVLVSGHAYLSPFFRHPSRKYPWRLSELPLATGQPSSMIPVRDTKQGSHEQYLHKGFVSFLCQLDILLHCQLCVQENKAASENVCSGSNRADRSLIWGRAMSLWQDRVLLLVRDPKVVLDGLRSNKETKMNVRGHASACESKQAGDKTPVLKPRRGSSVSS